MSKILLACRADYMDIAAEIPFMFKKAGCEVHVLCNENSTLLSGSYYDRKLESARNLAEFQKRVIEIAQTNEYDWIIATDDEFNKVMNECITSEDLFRKVLPLTRMENREMLSSKLGLAKLCLKYGITAPASINYGELPDAEAIKKKLQFPVLLKEDFSFSGMGIQYCESPGELETCLAKVREKGNLVIQEFISGIDIGVEALFKNGRLVTYNYAEVLSYMYSKFSFTTRRTYYRNKDVETLLGELGEKLGLHGFASIGYIYHPGRNLHYLIEADIRINSWMPYGRFTGGDFSKGIKLMLEPGDLPRRGPAIAPLEQKTEVAIFDRDMRRCVRFRDFKGLSHWLFNIHGYWRYIPFYDFRLFRKIMKKMVYDLLKIKY